MLTLMGAPPVASGGEDLQEFRHAVLGNAIGGNRYHKRPRRVDNGYLLIRFFYLNSYYFDLLCSSITSTIGAAHMVLPSGVRFHPREINLISKDSRAVIEIEARDNSPHNAGYKLNLREFAQAVVPYFNEDWEEFAQRFGMRAGGQVAVDGILRRVAYAGAEHSNEPKLPNITVLPNFETVGPENSAQTWTVLGSTMGHQHVGDADTPRIQELYEFRSYGMMVLCRPSQTTEIWVARAGDKVAVPNDAQMTLYNLGDRNNPLITLDFANPGRNPSDKTPIEESGPVLLAYYNDFEVVFLLNSHYLRNPNAPSTVQDASSLSREERQIRINRGGRSVLGPSLYERLASDPDVIGQFARLGVSIKRATNQAVLLRESTPPFRLYCSSPLALAAQPGSEMYRYFYPQTDLFEPIAGKTSMAKVAANAVSEKAKVIGNSKLSRNDPSTYEIVIEGVGDWVEKTYRPLMKRTAEELYKRVESGQESRYKRFHVIYANDSRWKDAPAWITDLYPWESYLDKADADDLEPYRFSSPDVVFVATPDSTHSEIAQEWLWRSPLVFVEKPFDSDLKNVHELMKALGRGPDPLNRAQYCDTRVLGLDHYQFYALSISHLSAMIEDHLGGALAEIRFFLAEDRAIEYQRDRSLQHGLTLDLLPHFLALLTYFGDIRSVDEIQVLEAGQYSPLEAISRDETKRELISERFHNETWSRLRFTFQDYSGSGYHVPCSAVIGKGFAGEVKFLEVKGRNGNSIRLDLCERTEAEDYPFNSLFFMTSAEFLHLVRHRVEEIQDPYDQKNVLRILYDNEDPNRVRGRVFRERYADLIRDLMSDTGTAAASTLSLTEGESIVSVLDRIWWAVQDQKPFTQVGLKVMHAI
jgi:predicted dehydrogenase